MNPNEEILLYDGKNKKIRYLPRLSLWDTDLGQFFPSSDKEISRMAGQPEDLNQVCQALKEWLIKNKGDVKGNMEIFYTLYDDDIKSISAISGTDFEYCQKMRRAKPCCATKSFAKQLIPEPKKKSWYNELYEFVGLPIVK